MRVLLTGGTGFIGQHLARALVDAGHDLVALVRSPGKRRRLPPQIEVLEGDLSIFADDDRVLPPCDVVIHLAGAVHAPNDAAYRRTNTDAVGHLLACLERQDWAPRRLLFASSLAAAGPSARDCPHTEADALHPIEIYGETKRDAEALLRSAPFPTTAFRPCIVLGPEDPATLTLYKAARRGVGMRASGPPQRLSFVDVADVVTAILAMMTDDRPGHRAYFVSHARTIDVVELWASVERAVERKVRVVALPAWALRGASALSTAVTRLTGGRNQLDRKQLEQILAPAFVCSSAALRGELGWEPQVDLDTSTRRAVDGYRSAGSL